MRAALAPIVLSGFGALGIFADTSLTSCPASPSGYQNAVYYPNWAVYQRDFHPQFIPVDHVTHVLYAFLNVREDGTVYSEFPDADLENRYDSDSWTEPGNNAYGCVKQLFKLKMTNRKLKTLLSIGGWTWSTNFPAVAATAQGRRRFAETAVEMLKDWGFDGIDVDWEFPSSALEGSNYILLLREVRNELDAYARQHSPGYHYRLSIAAPAGPAKYDLLDLAGIAAVVDSFYLMTYDFAGAWDESSGHQANIYPSKTDPNATPFSIERAVHDYVDAGVAPEKLILGMPVYGRGFKDTQGPGASFTNIGEGSWEPGIWDYQHLPPPGSEIRSDAAIGATWSYDARSHVMISFDTPTLVRQKVEYLKCKSMGGSMFWEASADRSDEESLIRASWDTLGLRESSNNQLAYPDSAFDNIRSSLK